MRKLWVISLAALLALLILPTGSAHAAPIDWSGPPFDRIITGDDYTLGEGTVERGNVVVLGGSVEIKEGATLDGDLTVFGGDVDVAGRITGNIVVLGGDVDVSGSAYIEGDFALFGGSAKVDEGAVIEGDMASGPEGDWFDLGEFDRRAPVLPELPEIPDMPSRPAPPVGPRAVVRQTSGIAEKVGSAFLTAIGIGIIAMLATLFLPRQTERTRQVLAQEPVTSGVVGLVTLLAAALVTPLLAVLSAILLLVCIGLLGFPVIVLLWLAIVAAAVFGWVVLGQLLGNWIGKRLSLQGMTPILEAGVGAFALALLVGLIRAVPYIGVAGFLLEMMLICVGLGAIVLTRFGTQSYERGQPIIPRRSAQPTPVPIETGEDAEAEEDGDSARFDAPTLDSEGPYPDK